MYLLFHSLSLIWFILITLSDSEGMDTHVLTRISKQYVRHTVTYNYEHSKRKGTIASTLLLLLLLLQYTKRTKKEEPILCRKNDQGGTRTHNLWIRSPTRYPLRHMTGSIWFFTTSIRDTPFVVGWTIFKWDVTPRTNAFIRFYAMNSRISIIERQRKSGIVQDLPLNSFRSTRSITFLIVLYCTCVYP